MVTSQMAAHRLIVLLKHRTGFKEPLDVFKSLLHHPEFLVLQRHLVVPQLGAGCE